MNWWQPVPGIPWQWQLTGEIDFSVEAEMFDVDLFETPMENIAKLHEMDRIVICYFSAGSLEEWRSDAGAFPEDILGEALDGWPDERWLDIRDLAVLGPLMAARLDLAVDRGCDGVEPDNVDGFVNDTGFNLSAEDQITYNTWLADEAHARGLSVGLKNDLDQVAVLEPYFDWALNEECFKYSECELLIPFISAGKAVFGVEYEGAPEDFCPQANAFGFDWLKKNLDLDAWRVACRSEPYGSGPGAFILANLAQDHGLW